ncbi:hypothetical protein [Kitasatospora sp. NPDC057223]|uniref:hypothetical protein n=1 Tax=Kitasatospora sp. NPDC057223 TaxID=3346055 RepID=UPI0036426D04
MTVRSEDAVEIVRAALALALPTASAEGLTRAAETVVRWGAEEATRDLTAALTTRMVLDLIEAAGEGRDPLRAFRSAEAEWLSPGRAESAAAYRTWSRSESMTRRPYLSRPQEGEDEPDGPFPPPASRDY